MPKLLRNILAILAGIIIGGVVNMAIIYLSPSLIPPPAGIDVSDAQSLAQNIHLFEPKHFLMPFLAHAIGTLVGAFAAYRIAATHKARFAYVIGLVFLCGGIAMCFQVPAPKWFMGLDLILAYIPMAWLGIQVAKSTSSRRH